MSGKLKEKENVYGMLQDNRGWCFLRQHRHLVVMVGMWSFATIPNPLSLTVFISDGRQLSPQLLDYSCI